MLVESGISLLGSYFYIVRKNYRIKLTAE